MQNDLTDKVVDDRVILVNAKLLQEEIGGLLLPDIGHEVIKRATIHKIGPACTQLVVGDIAVYQKGAGIEISYKEVKYLIVREGDILFTLNKEEFKIE